MRSDRRSVICSADSDRFRTEPSSLLVLDLGLDGWTSMQIYLADLISNWQKSVEIRRIGREFARISKRGRHVHQWRILEERLFCLIERDRRLHTVLADHNADRQTLQKICRNLEIHGGAHHVRGHWVTASALAFAVPLNFLLSKTQDARLRDAGAEFQVRFWRKLAAGVSDYFRMGGGGHIQA